MEEIVLFVGMGGKVGNIVKESEEKFFKCGDCLENHPCILYGVSHEDGYPDSNDEKWWIYAKCIKTSREFSYWKIKDKLFHV